MKMISGFVVSSKPISLSKAASTMNAFLSAETGASRAISTYLRNASASCNELVQFHRELKAGRTERKHKHKKKTTRLESLDNGEEKNLEVAEKDPILVEEEQSSRFSVNGEVGRSDDEGTKTVKKKKEKRKKGSDHIDEDVRVKQENGIADHVKIEEEEKKEKKKRKKEEIEDGAFDNSEERHRMKKKKKRKLENEN